MLFLKITFCFIFIHLNVISACKLVPSRYYSSSNKSGGDNGYKIVIGGNNTKYIPGEIYTVYLLGSRTYEKVQHFKRFLLSVHSNEDYNSAAKAGSFQLFKDSLAKFNENCFNTISEENDLKKTEVYAMWTAPPFGSGCVTFKAMVLEDSKHWFAEDGQLTKEFCEQSPLDVSKDEIEQCCACDEAKYNLIFEGIWSNKTHPKDFPFSLWLTHFSDLIGTTHVNSFSFWGEGQIATDGFRSLAEWGSIRLMAEELSRKKPYIKQIFKAPGLWYPNVNTNTTLKFSVDRKRHYVSMASMFGPSPDWFVGVNGLNLCLKNCSWIDNLVIDLYPWDAGTDSGITYMSPNLETNPREKMHKITTMYPEDPRAPFYDHNKNKMHPLARLYIQLEKRIPKSCDFDFLQTQLSDIELTSDIEEDKRPECKVSNYSDWSPCSVSCGKGLRIRSREYIMPDKAKMFNCNMQLISKEMCVADLVECPEGSNHSVEDEFDFEEDGICKTSAWSEWSECSEKCGMGFRMRTRSFIDRMGQKKCPHVPTVEKEKCMRPQCSQVDFEIPDPECPTTDWTDWSPCSKLCGIGQRVRLRLLLVDENFVETCKTKLSLKQTESCVVETNCSKLLSTKEICMQKRKVGTCNSQMTRWYFNTEKLACLSFIYSGCGGNENNFDSLETCNRICGPLKEITSNNTNNQKKNFVVNVEKLKKPIDCVVSEWSDWSSCSTNCGTGIMERVRTILIVDQNGGKPCPGRLVKRRKCIGNQCI